MPYGINSSGFCIMEQQVTGYFYLHQTDSTNKELWRMMAAGREPGEFTVVQTGHQTAGRGQGSTHWHSEAGKNLLFSVLLKPRFLRPSGQFMLNKCIALAIRDALASLCHTHRFEIKWPNDILADGGKIAGTLIENRITGRTLEYSVVGIGVNLNQQSFPPGISNPASLKMLTGKTFDAGLCMQAVIKEIKARVGSLRSDDTKQINTDYLAHLLGYGKQMRFLTAGEVIVGTIYGVNAFGKLLLKSTDGTEHAFDMKEIEFLM